MRKKFRFLGNHGQNRVDTTSIAKLLGRYSILVNRVIRAPSQTKRDTAGFC